MGKKSTTASSSKGKGDATIKDKSATKAKPNKADAMKKARDTQIKVERCVSRQFKDFSHDQIYELLDASTQKNLWDTLTAIYDSGVLRISDGRLLTLRAKFTSLPLVLDN